jgi:hypothetical protein
LHHTYKVKGEPCSIIVSPMVPFPSNNPAASRALSAFEFCFGAFIVIGHNVFHIVPNEVIVLSVLGLISIRLRDRKWSAMGLKQLASWRRILLIALVAAVLRILLGQFLIEPVNRIFLAEADRAGTGKRDHRELEERTRCFVARVDICRFRQGDHVPRISPDACS